MPPVVIDVRGAEDWRDVVHRAVQVLAEGGLVAFPTETVYGLAASALDERAVERLLDVKGRRAGQALTLAIKSADEARDYAPSLGDLGQRLARRCWPGPITLVVDASHPDSLLGRLPPKVRSAVVPEKTVGLRVPGHQIVLDTLRMLAGPLVLSSANRSGQPDATTAEEVSASLGNDLDLVLDDGPCRFGQPSSVVLVENDRYSILREGVVPETTLQRLSNQLILLVCTGNTCRSPMAEIACREMIAKRLNCSAEELGNPDGGRCGIVIMSAGVAAMTGGRASTESVQAVAELGMDLSGHESQPVTEPLVRHADLILTMTRSHREMIVAQWPGAAERTHTLCSDGSDIDDPIGSPLQRYKECLAQIRSELEIRLDELGL